MRKRKKPPIEEGQRIRLLALEGTIIEARQVQIGRTKKEARQSDVWAYSVQLNDGRINRFSANDFEVIETGS